MLELLTDPAAWAAFLTLTMLEIVLGVDNIIFISIVANRLPPEQRALGRFIGLVGALALRIILLASIAWIVKLTAPIMTVLDHPVSWRDIILLVGGLFLIYKATVEIHAEVEGDGHGENGAVHASFAKVIFQIMLLDLVFSLDSVITAVGMVDELPIMIAAVVVAILVMMAFATPIASFIERHPTTKMLALAFLVMVGMALVADGAGYHIERGFIYAAMAFSAFVELLNLARSRKRNGADNAAPGDA